MQLNQLRNLQRLAGKRNRLTATVNSAISGQGLPQGFRRRKAVVGSSTASMRRAISKRYGGTNVGLGDTGIWSDIGKVFVGNVSSGIANRIGGHAPASVTIVQPEKAAGFPKWVPYAAAGVGVLGLVLVLKR